MKINIEVLWQPFMIAQRFLEGEACVTVSLISYIVYKIREGVTDVIGNKHSSQHVICTRRKMLQKFNGFFGTRVEGTLGEDHLTEGPNSFMASLLDPTTN